MNGKKVLLVVEDSKPLRTAIKAKFESEGFEVLEAGDGEKGLNVFLKEKPDLILLDIVMPIMNGLEMLKRLRKHKEGRTVPVIILTNLSESEPTAEALQEGAYDFLVKADWKIEDVVEKVKDKLNLK